MMLFNLALTLSVFILWFFIVFIVILFILFVFIVFIVLLFFYCHRKKRFNNFCL